MFQTLIALGDTDQAKTGPAVGSLLPKHDLVRSQGLVEIVVHRGVVKSHRQNVVHGGAVAAEVIIVAPYSEVGWQVKVTWASVPSKSQNTAAPFQVTVHGPAERHSKAQGGTIALRPPGGVQRR